MTHVSSRMERLDDSREQQDGASLQNRYLAAPVSRSMTQRGPLTSRSCLADHEPPQRRKHSTTRPHRCLSRAP
nr:unnamed protein product [Digitaria exilis]